MADILIRGVPMPVPDFHTTVIIMGNGDVFWYNEKVGTAVPLPEGHGRLGDLDALEKELAFDYAYAAAKVCHNAPTIVPAEGGTDDDGNA